MVAQSSIQLFTLRDAMDQDLEGAIAEVAKRGFTAVEPYDFVHRADRIAAALKANNLSAPSGHAFVVMDSFVNPDGSSTDTENPTWDETFDAAEKLGMTTIVEPYTDPELWSDREAVDHIAARLNEAGKAAAKRGIRVAYHNHNHELEAEFDGMNGLEYLASQLDPDIALEVDLYWVERAGVDPVELVQRLGDRVRLVHAKDGTLEPSAIAKYPPEDQVPAGTGNIRLKDTIAAAPNLDLAIVEFDHYPGDDIYAAAEQSRIYLEEEAIGK